MSSPQGSCGTTYQGHRRRDEEACDECRKGHAAYVAEWRRQRPDLRAENVATQRARDRALRRLAQLHPMDMRRLYREEMTAGRVRQDRAS